MLSIIVAYDRNRIIGIENRLPWRLPNDLAYFKSLTTGKTVVMGRKTFESIGKALPNRKNIVLTKDKGFAFEGIETAASMEEVIQMDRGPGEEIFIIGGSSVYSQALPLVNKLYITYIDESFKGDAHFPKFEVSDWTLISDVKGEKNEKNPYDYSFLVYERKLD